MNSGAVVKGGSFVTGVILALFAIFGGVSAITPSPNPDTGNIINYDAP